MVLFSLLLKVEVVLFSLLLKIEMVLVSLLLKVEILLFSFLLKVEMVLFSLLLTAAAYNSLLKDHRDNYQFPKLPYLRDYIKAFHG